MALAIEGEAHTKSNGASSRTITLSNSGVDRIVVIMVGAEQTVVRNVSSVTSASLTFQKRSSKNATFTTRTMNVEVWWAYAAAQLASEVITVTLDGTADGVNAHGFSVSGAINFSDPWDANLSLPASESHTGSNVSTVTISTSQVNDILFGFYGEQSASGASAPSGFTIMGTSQTSGSVDNCVTFLWNKVVSALQSGVAVSVGSSTTNAVFIVDALTSDPIPQPHGQAIIIG